MQSKKYKTETDRIMKERDVDTVSLAALARLELTDAEHERMARELADFADFATVLSAFECAPELDGAAVPLEECHCREDQASESGVGIARGYVSVPLTVVAEQ